MMTKAGKIILTAISVLILGVLVFYCIRYGKTPEKILSEHPTMSSADALETAKQLSAAAETAWRNGTAVRITLADEKSTASSPDVMIHGSTVTINKGGIYRISGSLSDGQLAVDCGECVTLILDSAEITNSADAAVLISDAEHVLVYLPEGKSSRLVSGTEREITASEESGTETGAALYARDDLSVSGNGTLFVSGYKNNAVASTDHLTVLNGILDLTAANNGLKGKDSVTVLDGTITILAGNDGIKSDNSLDADCGTVDICGGNITITCFGDGVQADTRLSVTDGIITVSAKSMITTDPSKDIPPSDGPFSGNGNIPPEMPGFGEGEMPPGMQDFGHGGRPQDRDDRGDGRQDPFGGKEQFPGMPGQEQKTGNSSSVSTKGLKSGGDLLISGGRITVDSGDDCIHADGNITVTGGTLLLSSDDDGIHADSTVTVSDGDITVSESYEGIEGTVISVSGGTVSVTSSDDGFNANGGSPSPFGGMFGGQKSDPASLPSLTISGGTVYVNAGGDGLDSNGNLTVSGGLVIVDGPTDNGNGALDSGTESGGKLLCNGGTILAVGASGMAETFENSSAQCSFIKTYSGTVQAGTKITVYNADGNLLLEHTSAKTFNSLVFSDPALVIGSFCTVTVGEQTDTVRIESVSNGSQQGNFPGGFDGRGRR